MRLLPILLAVALVAVPVNADWGSGVCGPVGPTAPVGYQWVSVPEAKEICLYFGGVQIGSYRLSDRKYFALVNGQWQGPIDCPAALPDGVCQCPGGCSCPPGECHCDPKDCHCKKEAPAGSLPKGGVDVQKVEADKHILNGRHVSKGEIMEALGKASGVPQDASKLRLTVIGPPEATGRVLSELRAIPEASDYLIQAYTPDHWAVKPGFVTTGNPVSIYVETPDGRVLHRQADYQGGIQALAEALRNASDSYKADKDPDLRHKDLLAEARHWAEQQPPILWLALAGGLFLLFRRKETK